jgi:ABC-type transport system substrate-binding protein
LRKVGWIVFGAALVFAACSGDGTTPATAPPTSPGPSATVATTTASPPTTSPIETTTTTVDRIAEIEAILLDLVTRRTQALVDRNEESYREVFANQGLLDRSLPALDAGLFNVMPTDISVNIEEVLFDSSECIAARQLTVMTGREREDVQPFVVVLEKNEVGGWGFSFNGEGWACEGPHPFGEG